MTGSVYVVVQFYPWFNFYFLLFHIHYQILTQKEQRKIKIEPRIKLNFNIYVSNCLSFIVTVRHEYSRTTIKWSALGNIQVAT